MNEIDHNATQATQATGEVRARDFQQRCQSDILDQFLAEFRMLCKEIVNPRTRHWESFDAMSSHIELDYHGRCAIELTQNANDAAGFGGHLRFVLRDEDGLSVLYAANTGSPFQSDNFEAICNLGLSNKDPAENIGNKGLGFRSVLEVTTNPAIYSVCEAGDQLPGYCFQFGVETRELIQEVLQHFRENGRNQIDRLSVLFGQQVELLGKDDVRPESLQEALGDNSELLWRIGEKLYPYMFPLPSVERPRIVEDLWHEGFVTVVRLPLDRKDGLDTVTNALESLDANHLLFLKNLRQLEIFNELDVEVGHRRFRRLPGGNSNSSLRELVEECPETGELLRRSKFHCHRIVISGQDLVDAQASLGPRWKPVSKAEVTLAVELSENPACDDGLFSIGLPTEKPTGSGLWIDGPFFGDINRKQIDFTKRYNRILLESAANGVPQLIETIRPATAFDRSIAALKSLDFRGSASEFSSLIEPQEVTSSDEDSICNTLAKIPLLKPYSEKDGQEPRALALRELRVDPGEANDVELQFLTRERLSQHFDFAHEHYYCDDETRDLLLHVASQFGGGDEPDLDEICVACEMLAAELVEKSESLSDTASCLRQLYEDLGELFPFDHQRAEFLNRTLLMDQDGQLRPTNSKDPLVFEPRSLTKGEQEASTIQDDVPSLLKKKIVFLHGGSVEQLPPSKGTSRSAKFLRGTTPVFVQTFDTRDLVNNLAGVSSKRTITDEEGREILQWAYKLWGATGRSEFSSDVRWNRLRVPATSGDEDETTWVQARDTYFSSGWDSDHGDLLEQALARKDRKSEGRSFLLRPSKFFELVGEPPGTEFGEEPLTRWEKFLREILRVHRFPRVRLQSATRAKSRRDAFVCRGKDYHLLPEQGLKNVADLPQAAWQHFLAKLASFTHSEIDGLIQGAREFEVEHYVWLDGFSQVTVDRGLPYATLVCRGIEHYQTHLTCKITRVDNRQTTPIPTTLSSLLHTSEWLPADRHQQERELRRPEDVLIVDRADLSRNPNIPTPCDLLPHVPQELSGEGTVRELAKRIGLGHFDDLGLSDVLRWLDWLSSNTDEAVSSIQRSLWNDMIRRAAQRASEPDADLSVLDGEHEWTSILSEIPQESSRSRVGLWKPSNEDCENGGPLYLPDDQRLANQVSGKLPIAAVGKCTQNIVRFLQRRFGNDAIRRVSELTLVPKDVETDLASLDPSQLVPLREMAPWLIRSVLAVLAYGRPEIMNVDGKSFRGHVSALIRLRVCEVDDLRVEIVEAPGVKLKGEAFAWAENNVIIIDRSSRASCRVLFDALGDYLGIRDLPQHALYHLGELATLGLESCPSSNDTRSALLKFLAENELSRLDRRLDAEQFFVVSRILPGLLAVAPTLEKGEEIIASHFQQAFNSGAGLGAVEDAWNELFGSSPVPPKLDSLMQAAASDIPTDELAWSVFEKWHVDIPTWNAKAALHCPEVGNIENSAADEMVAKAQDRLMPTALAILRAHLEECGNRAAYREIRARMQGELLTPKDAKRTWAPSDRTLAIPLAHAMAGTKPGGDLPGWATPMLPGETDNCESSALRLKEMGLEIRDDEDTAYESNWPRAKSNFTQLQLLGLARWTINKGFGEVPDALYAKEPRQLLTRDQVFRCDSLLDFTPNDEAAAFQWSQEWWKATGLGSAIDELPKVESIKEVVAAWGISDSDLVEAESRRKELRKVESKNRRKIRLLNEDYFIPADGGYPGLRKLIDARLDPTFGEGLDPKKRDSLLSPTQPSVGKPGSRKFKGGSKISEQDEFVGAVGEYMVFCAIRKMTKNRIGSIAWKSENRNLFVDDGEEGDDSLGYDFRFRWKGQIYEIEVKSSKNKTPQQVRLGPTEVRRGQECAGKRKSNVQWQIWLATDVLAAPAIHLLGNPYASDERAHFVIDALGARVGFHLGYKR